MARAAAAHPGDHRLGRRLLPDAPDGVPAEVYAELAGKTVFSAQQRVVELLRESGDLEGDPRRSTTR